jgi:hypothetical protein
MTTPTERLKLLAEADPAAASQVVRDLGKAVFVPHDGGQAEVSASDARFRVLRAGRRWGKTQLAAHECLMAALAKPNQMVWWIANSDKNVRRGYRAVKAQVPRLLLTHDPPSEGANDRILRFRNGSQIEFYTAGTPDALAGEGVDFVVVDEAALIPEDVWFRLLRPTLADTHGRALIISTPRGRNWFYTVWMRGQGDNKMYKSWHFISTDSPYIDEEEIEDARQTLPDLIFRAEHMAEFVANAASMFILDREGAVQPGLTAPDGWVYMGVDLAKKEDFTVISASNADTRLPCYYDRWNDVSWAIQEDYIMNAVKQLEADPNVEGVTVGVDSTGLGEVVFDSLDARGLDVVPVNFASGNIKERMVRQLSADLEHGRAHIIEEMREEFESYEYNITPQGRYKFEAATGHDDRVSAKLIENWIAVHEGAPGIMVYDPAAVAEKPRLVPAEVRRAVKPDAPADIMSNPAAWG